MPFVRIDLQKGKSADYRQCVGQVVYDALISVGVPKDDRFQVIQEHAEDSLIFDPGYLGVARSKDFISIRITWNEGRNVDQKRALYRAIADGLHASVGLRPEDVFINLIEVKKENWSFGNGEAQYAT
ncbi:MAG: tautomerase family protein [Gammaproteobacteria bacterium]|nr:tautomerase family protein [Gammaproteobacteria bacterium]